MSPYCDSEFPGNVQVFRNEEKERLRIVDMRQCDAERIGVNRGTRWRMKKILDVTIDNKRKY
jgi:hypothetical protein